MKAKQVPRRYDSYIIHKTEQFQTDINETYDFLLKGEKKNDYRQGYAVDWYNAVADFIEGMKTPIGSIGKIDADNFSDIYAFKKVPDTHSTALFLVEENHIFLARIDLSTRKWKRLMQDTEHDLKEQIQQLRNQSKTQKKN